MDSIRVPQSSPHALQVPALALVQLSPAQLSLYLVYMSECNRRGGRCSLGLLSVAKTAGMSVTTARAERDRLIDLNWIRVVGKSSRGRWVISVVDRSADNEKYALEEIAREDAVRRRRLAKIRHAKAARAAVAKNYDSIFVALGRRDGFRCRSCGAAGNDLQIDHVFPVSAGGSSDLDNLQLLCKPCNFRKGAKVDHG